MDRAKLRAAEGIGQVSASRRELIVGGGCLAMAGLASGAAAAVGKPVLLTDDPRLAGAGAIVLPTGRFIDDALVTALPAGRYTARLSPANTLLLSDALRLRRVATEEAQAATRFTIPGRRA